MTTALLVSLPWAVACLACYGLMRQALREAALSLDLAKAATWERDRMALEARRARELAHINHALARFWRDLAGERPGPVRHSPARPGTIQELMPGPTVWEDDDGDIATEGL